ncbi:hypothetical protein GQ651_01270 [Alphaproteobacteria bacterium GH1-50]|uniref:Cytochrome b561 n=1 Tax=Kangsaoukella pontilimi TaxID=2691042 RepID=A0A7C9IE40_9RHOB|nr:hypothetical protein [Kangsaoukella pontilimi]MXQ06468.1 hypothetical protein [Kangsaoukella pontilimi]
MTRRRLVIFCHWSTAFLLAVLLIEGRGASSGLIWAFSALCLVWAASYAIGRGPLGRPGPKLTGWLRPAHRIQHHLLYLAMTAAAVLVVWQLDATATGRALKVLLFAGLLHGAFHLWRHTSLFDGALRTITPRAFHHLL